MIDKIVMVILWGFISIFLLFSGGITLEYAYIGMCIILAAGLLHKEDEHEQRKNG